MSRSKGELRKHWVKRLKLNTKEQSKRYMDKTNIEMINWARELKRAYDEAGGNYELAEVADKMADFIDEFINQNK
jgi:hypothetical protein